MVTGLEDGDSPYLQHADAALPREHFIHHKHASLPWQTPPSLVLGLGGEPEPLQLIERFVLHHRT